MIYDIYLNGTKVGEVNSEGQDHLLLVKEMYPENYKISIDHEDKIVHVVATMADVMKWLNDEMSQNVITTINKMKT